MLDRDLYELLGVEPTATDAEIRKAFHKLAKQYHPDRNPGDQKAEQKFKEVNFAHEVLRDKKKRAQYDQMRAARARGFGGGPGMGGMGGPGGAGGRAWHYEGDPFSAEAFGDFGLGDLFQEIFGGGFAGASGGRAGGFPPGGFQTRGRGGMARRGSDREASLGISFQEACRGGERALDFTDGRRITVKIPAGVKDGGKIKLSQQGDPGVNGGPAGDLLLTLQVQAHPLFEREGNDILLKLPISFSEAVLGTEVSVPTLDGSVSMKIPKGVSSGQRLKLKNRGVGPATSEERGHQFVELLIKVPKSPSEAFVQAAQGLQNEGFNPREDWH